MSLLDIFKQGSDIDQISGLWKNAKAVGARSAEQPDCTKVEYEVTGPGTIRVVSLFKDGSFGRRDVTFESSGQAEITDLNGQFTDDINEFRPRLFG